MTTVIGVKFRNVLKVFYFDPAGLDMQKDTQVVVETVRGLEIGTVVIPATQVEDSRIAQPLKPVLRIATMHDIMAEADNELREKDAFVTCKEKIVEHGLDMKLISAQYTLDGNKLMFCFSSEGRVDFRELVRDLAGVFRTRIELRQIGVRDETKILGGMGMCGRPLCCHTFLSEFAPVSIKMAKEQNLSLNPTKISGTCGRLMCCLKNECEVYEELNRTLPKRGDIVHLPDGIDGTVSQVNILRQQVKVLVTLDNDEKEIREYPVTEITFEKKKKGSAQKPKKEKEPDKENSKDKGNPKDRESGKEEEPGRTRERAHGRRRRKKKDNADEGAREGESR